MSDEIKVGRLARDLFGAEVTITREADKPMRLSFPASSEMPVQRWFGEEVLRHDDKSIRMDRLNGGAAPLLFNHNWSDPVGMVDGASVKDGRLWVDAHFFDTDRARDVAAMVEGGMRNVSIGYELYEVTEDTKANRFTATDWGVLEVSFATVPADPSVGVGRDADTDAKPVRVTRSVETKNEISIDTRADLTAIEAVVKEAVERAIPKVSTPAAPAVPKEKATMADTQAAAGTNADTRLDPLQVEKDRKEAISAMCRSANIDSRIEDQWIRDGVRLEEVAGKILKTVEERGKSKPAVAAELGLTNNETQRYSILRAIRALKFGGQFPQFMQEAAFEVECSNAVAKKLGRGATTSFLVPAEILQRPVAQRAMATTPGSKGGFMVDSQNMGFVDMLRNRMFAGPMGCTFMSGLEGNVVMPRQTGAQSITWQAGEGTSITAADQALGQLSLTPKTAIAITDVSEQLLRQSSPSAEAFVMNDLAKVLAIGVDSAIINGTGGAQPLGIKNTTGVTTGQDAASATYAKILAFWSTAAGSNAVLSNPGFLTNAAGAAVLMKTQRFSSTDTPLWEGNGQDGTCVGFRAMSTEQVAASNLIFGSWGEVIVGEWGVLELATDTGGTRFNAAQVGIRAMWMVDVLVRYPQAFVVSTNLS
jgi:HK97 family phage major capsid protein/HK97 family phage prohead protease